MRDADRRRFAAAMTAVAELYGRTMSDALLEIYWRALSRYELDAIEQALARHALNPDHGQFMPKPADLIRVLEGGGVGRAALAWTQVAKAVRCIGGYESVVFDDPITQAVIHDMGGWIVLCDSLGAAGTSDSNFPFQALNFEKRYRAYLETGRQPVYPSTLLGRADADNVRRGLPVRTRLIGDKQKARLVYQQGQADAKQITSEPVGNLLGVTTA